MADSTNDEKMYGATADRVIAVGILTYNEDQLRLVVDLATKNGCTFTVLADFEQPSVVEVLVCGTLPQLQTFYKAIKMQFDAEC